MFERDQPVGNLANVNIMRDDDQGVPLGVQLAENIQHDFFVRRVQVAGRLVSQNDLGLVDERAGDTDALLLTSLKLCRQMMQASTQPYRFQCEARFGFIGHAVEILRQDSIQVIDQVDETVPIHDLIWVEKNIGNKPAILPMHKTGRMALAFIWPDMYHYSRTSLAIPRPRKVPYNA